MVPTRKWLLTCIFLQLTMLFPGCQTTSQELSFQKNTDVLGVWWWWVDQDKHAAHLDFAQKNGVNEIYYWTDRLNNRTGLFVEAAKERNIKVFWLLEKYQYIWDYDAFSEQMKKYMAYQASAPENRQFAGIHLDIEPQVHPDFDTDKLAFLQDYIDFIVWVCDTYRDCTTIDLDIAYWFDYTIKYRGVTSILYQALMTEADRIFVMSYKDTAEQTYKVSKEEIAFAKSLNKQIILGAETGDYDYEPNLSYYGKGTGYFYGELQKLRTLVNYDNVGISIHQITTWYAMGK